MKVIAFNGSPRKTGNTATLLNNALKGATAQGAETEMIHLYDLTFKGCMSCYACKERAGKSYGRCKANDDLSQLLKDVREADGVILGSPIYCGTVSGEMKSFMERLLFPYATYTHPQQSLFPGKLKVGLIYTMNITEEQMKEYGLDRHLGLYEMYLRTLFGSSETMFCFDTSAVDDYAKIIADIDAQAKAKRRKEAFPKDCQKAFELGATIART